MAFTEDLAVFINADTPGYVLATVGGVGVGALFDNGFSSAFDIAGSGPRITLPAASAPSAALGDAVTVSGVSYTITGIEPDGLGLVVLKLQEV